MSPAEHLKELRNRSFICLLSLVLAFLEFYRHRNTITSVILNIGTDAGFRYIYKAPQALFMQELKLCLILSLVVVLPILTFQVLAFILPAFNTKMRTVLIPVVLGYGLFMLGIFASYKWFTPFIMSFLCNIGTNLTSVSSIISIEDYLVFFTGLLMAVGVIFEIPLISAILCRLGLINAGLMRKGRKIVIVLAFVVSAIITPPDVLSQIIVAIPILLLYELSIMLCRIIERRKVRRNDICQEKIS